MFMLLQARKKFSGRFYRFASPQILDLLQFSRQETERGKLFLRLKKRLHKIDGRYDAEKDLLVRSRLRGQREILRRRVERAALMYCVARRERVRLFGDYISRLPLQTKEIYAVKQ